MGINSLSPKWTKKPEMNTSSIKIWFSLQQATKWQWMLLCALLTWVWAACTCACLTFFFNVPATKGASILNMGQPHMICLGIGRSFFLWNFSLFLFSFSVFSSTYKKTFKTRSGLAANSCWLLLSEQWVPQEKFNSKLPNYKYCQEFLKTTCKTTDDS